MGEGISGGSGGRITGNGGRAFWAEPELRERLVSFARRFVGDRGEAEDIAQETLMRAATGQATLRSRDRAEAWLFRICRHAAIDYVRARRVRRGVWAPMSDEIEAWATPAPSRRRARGFDLGRLPAHHRLLMALYYERGLSQPTLCRMTGLSASALRVRLFRARAALGGGA